MSPKRASSNSNKLTVRHQTEPDHSTCPSGEKFPLPRDDEYASEFKKMQKLVEKQRLKNREIVVVMGVGFVGSVMAGVVADSVDPESDQPTKFVIGMQRPSTRSFWKILYLNRGMAPVEAMAAGTPVVATRSGALVETVQDGKTGLLVDKNDASTLATAILKLLENDELRESMSRAARQRALEYFTWDRTANLMLQLCKTI